ncbi:MAG: gas vesicle protein GvpG [Deltaproteobacteria bacterium]|nr:gas vesicle protein GvpG [Deltaproteobacteria bacterium]
MFIVDDILLSPFKGLYWVFNEILNAAQEDQAGEANRITGQLSELYMMLETGKMTEEEFDAAEKVLLDRLEAIKEREDDGEDESSEDDDSEDEGVGIH